MVVRWTDGRTDNQTRLQVWQVHHGYKGLPMVLVFTDDDPLETGNVFFQTTTKSLENVYKQNEPPVSK